MNHSRYIILFCVIGLQLGCQTVQTPIKTSQAPKPTHKAKPKPPSTEAAKPGAIEEHPETEKTRILTQQPANETAKPFTPPPSEPSAEPEMPAYPSSPAASALMQEAEGSRNRGDIANASAILERAIRIQPRNPIIWQQLADIRLSQHQPDLAEDLAKKSSVLASGNKTLIRKNWQLIAEARRQKNDLEGAMDADFKASQ